MDIMLRNATLSDAYLLFQWANSKDVRSNSFNTNSIEYGEHLSWLQKKLNSKDCYIFILEDGEHKIGQIRIDIKNSKAIIDYSIDQSYRGKGYGVKILAILEGEIIRSGLRIDILEGKVKKSNILSQKCFEKNNYKRHIEKNFISYKKNIECKGIV